MSGNAVQFHYAARSDVGLVRSNNQDSGYAGANLLVLADGMGGPAGGDIASSVALAHLVPLDTDSHPADSMLPLLREALLDAHEELTDRSSRDRDLEGLGTTCIALMRSGNRLAMVHIGDSRAYVLRGDTLTQVTTDHSFVQYLVDTGQITPEEAEHHPNRNVVLKILGDAQADVAPDETIREAVVGDRWMLCSDGLSGLVSPETIGQVMADIKDPGECAEELIRLALLGGGPDNITCVIADIVPAGTYPPAPPQIVGAAAIDRNAKSRGGEGAAARAAALGSSSSDAVEVDADPVLRDRPGRLRRHLPGHPPVDWPVAALARGRGLECVPRRPVPRRSPAPRHAGAAFLARRHRLLHRGPQALRGRKRRLVVLLVLVVDASVGYVPVRRLPVRGAERGRLLMATVSIAPARPRRFLELTLMGLALAVGIAGYVLTSLNYTGEIPANLLTQVGVLVAIAIIAEVGVHFLAPYADPVILPIAVALTGLGLAMIYRLDLSYARRDEAVVGFRQALFVGIAIVIAAVILITLRDHRMLRRYTYTFGVLSLFLLLLPMIPGLGQETFGARVWIHLGPISIQPGELVKITLAIFFAGYLVTNRDNLAIGGRKFLGMRLPRARDLGPIMVVWLIGIAILVLQRDLGTSLLFFGLFVAMLYVATNRVSWLVIGFALFVPAVLVAVKSFAHVQTRFNIWLNALDPDIYNQGSYQLVQGLFGQASGGLMGTGWGRGYPQLVPLANSDFILSSFAEELGLTGMAAILVLYLILIQRGLRAALTVRDGFGKLLATGLSFSLAIQLFVVLGGITRIIPLTGLTAPFLAAGGSSMVSSWITVALLIRVSDAARRPASTPAPWNSGIQPAVGVGE